MTFPKKTVIQLTENQLPEPFASYWKSHDKLNRPEWTFCLVDGELYIHDREDDLMTHWTTTGCCGVWGFCHDRGIVERNDLPYVAKDGTYLFEVYQSGDYETSARNPETGQSFVVHTG